MEAKRKENIATSKGGKMPSSNSRGYAYRVAMNQNDQALHDDEYWPKAACRIVKYALCFIPWCALLLVFVFFAFNYDQMYRTTNKCKVELMDKARNESVLQAKVGEHKQVNVVLNKEMRDLQTQLDIAEEKYANATKEIKLQASKINILTLVRDGLRGEVNELKRKTELAEEKASTAQDKIDLYIKTIKELKENLNLRISTDFLMNGGNSAFNLVGASYYVIFGLTTYYYGNLFMVN